MQKAVLIADDDRELVNALALRCETGTLEITKRVVGVTFAWSSGLMMRGNRH